jgi:2-C-methyl-D-erythritol 4-phosphate cytidylyltransferase/2-C-methyl-D-erythritol 2,4-cyclodiphosphate synthase
VHDAARPFVTGALIGRVIAAAAEHGAALPARRSSDTVKRAAPAGGPVLETIPRETIWLAQTPQGFRRDVLTDAIRKNNGADATDEAMMAERAGPPVHLVEGDEDNLKITTLQDLESARVRMQSGLFNRAELRVGSGYDLHRLVEGRSLVLAGVEIPFDKGPHSHSDGDVICHALCDALFGAAAMGDIGRHFSNTDPKWKDAPGLDLLQRAAAVIREDGWRTASVDCTVILEKPKLAPFIEPIRQKVARALGIQDGAVSVKAKTNEGVDAVGRGEAIAAHAVAVVTRAEPARRARA